VRGWRDLFSVDVGLTELTLKFSFISKYLQVLKSAQVMINVETISQALKLLDELLKQLHKHYSWIIFFLPKIYWVSNLLEFIG